nr:MAG TPA: hypothetical protein [Caudoviricetes sp.]
MEKILEIIFIFKTITCQNNIEKHGNFSCEIISKLYNFKNSETATLKQYNRFCSVL